MVSQLANDVLHCGGKAGPVSEAKAVAGFVHIITMIPIVNRVTILRICIPELWKLFLFKFFKLSVLLWKMKCFENLKLLDV